MSGMNMGMGMRQDMRQGLHLAPRMIQSMEVLQLSVMQLQEKLTNELQENPFLEVKEKHTTTEAAPAEGDFNADAPLKHDETGDIEFARMDEINRDWGDHFNEDHRPSRSLRDELGDKKLEAMQNVADTPQSLQEHLAEQLGYLDLTHDQTELAEFLISHLDENGYLLNHDPDRRTPIAISFEELASTFEVVYHRPVTVADVEEALGVIHKLEPAGVGARDTKECLLLQVDDDIEHSDLVAAIIQHHLEDVAHNRLPAIQRRTGSDLDTIKEAIDELKRLDPRPGARFHSEGTQFVVPDAVVSWTDEGEFDIKLTKDWTPNVRVSSKFADQLKNKEIDPKVREELIKKYRMANWLVEAIEQRRNTLTKVTREIMSYQRAFLEKGPDHIQPLKMEQIAEKVGVHVTTVSRAVDDKWVQTPRGVFPLRRFFGGGTKNAQTGVDVAWETIKQKLQEIIAAEDKAKPLSDEEIVEKFKAFGLTVARRTVTKYREAMSIPSSRQRKDWAATAG
ncbi:RNA polymerase factor sigma-54 [Limnoglobus roseus]|uniref:RNA polymerase sigma-54 factor n=1 Tax=Limnoglobus roseus TaxID=2598579 RepID=A0A5C1A925_9BACT|nr:RNA polymerase factor sigma-54 [Limnoglobus roseus]QEL15210.1 RNA polymerase sigma-54 factor [Limnoglobus roseus]